MWWQKRKQKVEKGRALYKRVKDRLVTAIFRMQFRVVAQLNHKLASLPVKTLKIVFVGICLSGGGLSGRLVMQAFTKKEASKALLFDSIQMPSHVKQTDEGRRELSPLIFQQEYHRLQTFHALLDSLQQDKMGRRQYDSLLKARPHLLDSIAVLEQFYSSLQKH